MTCHLTMHEIKRPELEPKLVAEMVAERSRSAWPSAAR